MACLLGYHSFMRRWVPVILIVVGMAIVPAMQAQINGTRASVTSLGGSTVFPPGPRASVTSLGPNGYTPRFNFPNCCFNFDGRHHHHNGFVGDSGRNGRNGVAFGVLPLYSMPYYYGGYGDVANPVDDSMEQTYGPVSDNARADRNSAAQQQNDDRLSRLEQQMDDIESSSKPSSSTDSEPARPMADQPNTVLVFRDGHSIDVKNYAIVGDTLYEFSNGSRHKIALADLDLIATQKQNDERGLDFRLPMRPLGN